MDFLEALEWRYATKKFDASKSVTDERLKKLLKATNLTATSYGLQPFKFVVVQNKELQGKLVASSYGQSQVAEASHLIVIATRTDVDSDYISRYVDFMESERGMGPGDLDGFKKVMNGTIAQMTAEEKLVWAEKQAYIALGTLLAACATLQIDACPMEGFVPSEYDDILKLNEQNLHACVVIPIGYRSTEDKYQHLKKIRQPLDEVIVHSQI